MDPRLQEAIDAARTGETRAAQQLLTDLLADDPAQVQAWFLLSHLVDAPEKQQAYLGKALALDPTHEQARQRLALLRSGYTGGAVQAPQAQPAVKIADAGLDVLVQAEGDTLPDWMAEDAELVQIETAVAPLTTPAPAAAALPEWLQESVSHEFLGTPDDDDITPPPARPTIAVRQAAPAKAKLPAGAKADVNRWNLVLIALGVLAIIVLILLVNAILTL